MTSDGNRRQPDESTDDGRDGAVGRGDLAFRLSDLARTLHRQDSPQETLYEIVRAAVDTVPGADHAGISLVHARREVRTAAATDEVVMNVDRTQYQVGRGPCLDALYEHRSVNVPDTANEPRWGEFIQRARDYGVASLLSFQLFVAEDNLGALNLYSSRPAAFDDESEHVGLLFASHAAVALANALELRNLTLAVQTRDLIGQAKGILMERYKLTGEQAFALLVRASQQTNTKLRDLAEQLVATGELAVRP